MRMKFLFLFLLSTAVGCGAAEEKSTHRTHGGFVGGSPLAVKSMPVDPSVTAQSVRGGESQRNDPTEPTLPAESTPSMPSDPNAQTPPEDPEPFAAPSDPSLTVLPSDPPALAPSSDPIPALPIDTVPAELVLQQPLPPLATPIAPLPATPSDLTPASPLDPRALASAPSPTPLPPNVPTELLPASTSFGVCDPRDAELAAFAPLAFSQLDFNAKTFELAFLVQGCVERLDIALQLTNGEPLAPEFEPTVFFESVADGTIIRLTFPKAKDGLLGDGTYALVFDFGAQGTFTTKFMADEFGASAEGDK